jgi:hypothetical protein
MTLTTGLPVCRWLVFPNSNGNVDKLGRADVVDKRVLVDFTAATTYSLPCRRNRYSTYGRV